jgi:hypothetical protein
MARRGIHAETQRRRGAETLPLRLRGSAALRELFWILDPVRPMAERLPAHDRKSALALLAAALADAAKRP